jgi:hypothetical protein
MINAKQIIEHFQPCSDYEDYYLYNGIIQSCDTLRDVLYNRDVFARDKGWLIYELLSSVHPHFNFVWFYGASIDITYYEKDIQRQRHCLLSDVITYLEEVAYHILYEQGDNDDD